jgi:hypothetical protein
MCVILMRENAVLFFMSAWISVDVGLNEVIT